MCHEYGHLLGLPDLYNVDYLRSPEAPPEEDSAGIGAWGLMGWGARGWNGHDGPNSFSAWSRERLGWCRLMEVSSPTQQVRLEPVGQGGTLIKVPLAGREYFLLEYRTRSGNHYDRNIPGEGLLIWHVGWRPSEGDRPAQVLVDLECADGRWSDAGFPLGRQPDGRGGGDNLDFWAHDTGYSERHGGNVGDATDPFDGVHYREFTPDSNPDSYSTEGRLHARVENIRFENEMAVVDIRTRPLLLEPRNLFPLEANGDRVVVSGEEVMVSYHLTNSGGHRALGPRVELHSDDPWIEILQPVAVHGDLGVGETSAGPGTGGFPKFRFGNGFSGTHTAILFLDTYAGEVFSTRREFTVTGVSPRMDVREVQVLEGGDDSPGRVQAGAFIRLGLILEVPQPDILDLFSFHLLPLHEGVILVGDSRVEFEGGAGSVRSLTSPEFLLPSVLAPGSIVEFGFEVASGFGAWRDTLSLEVQPGPDRTPPRFNGFLHTRPGEEGVTISLPANEVLERGAFELSAVVYSSSDTSELATIPLRLRGDHYEGLWASAEAGTYLLGGSALDRAGNLGLGPLQDLHVPAQVKESEVAGSGSLDLIGPPADRWTAGVRSTGLSQSNPEVLYATTQTSLWRSMDGGRSWSRTGLMLSGAEADRILVDPQVPSTLYLSSEFLRSLDGGNTWEAMVQPVPGTRATLSAADPVRSGRLYAKSEGRLWISEDGGRAWTETNVRNDHRVVVHREELENLPDETTAPATVLAFNRGGRLYAASPNNVSGNLLSMDFFAAEEDRDSKGWRLQGTLREKKGSFRELHIDPDRPHIMVGRMGRGFWRSEDAGRSWNFIHKLWENSIKSPSSGMAIDPREPGVYYAVAGRDIYRSEDFGETWEPVGAPLPDPVEGVAMDPARVLYAVVSDRVWTSEDRTNWEVGGVVSPGAPILAIAAHLEDGSRLYAASTDGVYLSRDKALTWTLRLRLESEHWSTVRIRFDPHHRERVLVVTGRQLHETLDAGRSWRLIRYNDNIYPWFNDIAVHPRDPSVLLAATPWGVLRLERGTITAVEAETIAAPKSFALYQNFPNPFNGQTVISYRSAKAGPVKLVIYNLMGQSVRHLVDEVQPAGFHRTTWNRTDDGGTPVASGCYLYRLTAGSHRQTRRLVVLK